MEEHGSIGVKVARLAVRVIVVGLIAALSACTRRSVIEVPVLHPTSAQDKGPTGLGQDDKGGKDTKDKGAISTKITSRDLQGAGIELKDLSYALSFANIESKGTINFTADGSATLSIDNLPTGVEGTLNLDILQKGAVVLTGKVEKLTLQLGMQSVNITLHKSNSQTSSVTIQVAIDYGPGATPTATPTSTPTATPTTSTSGSFNWDGKSFLGNAKWDIVPVN